MSKVSRRDFVKGAAVGVAGLGAAGVLTACSGSGNDKGGSEKGSEEFTARVLSPTTMPTAETGSNFNVVPDSQTQVGSVYENLMTAIGGETYASAKYLAFADVAKKEGFSQIERLFTCTSDAEQIHIGLLYNLAKEIDPSTELPDAPTIDEYETDVNLILAANGEIYETSDMYPSFIQQAIEEGNNDAVQVFTRAKLAESVHAERYLDVYNFIDEPDDDVYYLCPICGYIHKGEAFTACPICLTPKDQFNAY